MSMISNFVHRNHGQWLSAGHSVDSLHFKVQEYLTKTFPIDDNQSFLTFLFVMYHKNDGSRSV